VLYYGNIAEDFSLHLTFCRNKMLQTHTNNFIIVNSYFQTIIMFVDIEG